MTITATSTDPEGLTVAQMTHTWALTSRPSGSAATVSATTGTNVTVTPDVAGTYTVRLISSDGPNASPAFSASFTAAAVNLAPTAQIGSIPGGIIAGRTVTLNATSTDPEGLTPAQMTHTWTLVSAPGGNLGTLSSSSGTSVTLRPTVDGAYSVRLVTSDGVNTSAPVTTNFTIAPNTAPTAVLSAAPVGAITGVPLTFSSAGSTDPNGDTLTTTWTLSGPSGSLSSPSTPSVNFTPTSPGSYTVQLVVSDGLATGTASRTFTVTGNAVPVAIINVTPTNRQVPQSPLGTATLTAASTDADSPTLTHRWRITSQPAGSSVSLSASTGNSVTLAPTVVGDYVVELISNDGVSDSSPTTRTIRLNAPPTVAFVTSSPINSPFPYFAGDRIEAANTGTTDPESDALTYSWVLTRPAGSAAVLDSGTATTPSTGFVADIAGTYVLALTASDGINQAVTFSQSIAVAVPAAPVACSQLGGSIPVSTRFAVPTGAAAGSVSVGSNGTTAGNSVCFHRTTTESIRGSDLMTSGRGSFHYFEVRRAGPVAVGVVAENAGTATRDPVTAELPDLIRSVTVSDGRAYGGGRQTFQLEGIGGLDRFGIAVDYRQRNPIVYVIGRPNSRGDNSTACTTAFAATNGICVVGRFRLDTTDGVRLYAYGRTEFGTQARLTINGLETLAANNARDTTQLSEAAVRAAIRASWQNGDAPLAPVDVASALDNGLNAQWPVSGVGTPTPPAAPVSVQPVVTRTSLDKAVLRLGSATGFRTTFTATAVSGGSPATTSITWTANGAPIAGQTGGTLNLVPLAATGAGGLGVGRHHIGAQVANADGVIGAASFELLVLPTVPVANDPNEDSDGDGVSFTDETTALTDPANPDTDGNGIADGVTGVTPTGTNTRVRMYRELGITPQGISLPEDGSSAFFSSELNPECVANPVGPAGAVGVDYCFKRGVRANVGIPSGSFRYFEVTRLTATPTATPNMGAGIIESSAAIAAVNVGLPTLQQRFNIDPFCCFTPSNALEPRTPLAITANFAGNGFWSRLVNQQGTINWGPATQTLGVAVDYRTAGQVTVYFVYQTGAGPTIGVSEPITLTSFSGDAIPLLFGHPEEVAQSVNFGLKPFYYDTASRNLRAILSAAPTPPASVGALRPGVGIHERVLRP